jgi:hypothetical protein
VLGGLAVESAEEPLARWSVLVANLEDAGHVDLALLRVAAHSGQIGLTVGSEGAAWWRTRTTRASAASTLSSTWVCFDD